MESVFKLTSELKQGLSIQKEMGNILKEEEQVIDEVDQLTYQTIIKIIREEYKQGSVSVKRLSQIIRRILPDVKDLKKLLPQLKNGLLAAGMSLSDFLQLTKELHKELEGDGLLDALEMGAEKLGLTVEDIVQAINTNPQEAAKIIVLASEIKQGTGTDQAKLSTLLTEYIESVSSQIALESNETAGQEGGKILENVIHQIETELIGKLKTQGVADSILSDVEKQLAEKFPKTLQNLKTDWIVNAITDGQDLSSDNLLQLMGNIVNKKADFETVKTPIEEALRERGIEADQVEDIFNEIVSRLEKNKNKVPVPKNVLSSNNTKFFLQREIKENVRYHNPFSCIAVSVDAKFVDGIWQEVSKDDNRQVIPKICEILKGFLRDLDLVGSFGKLEEQNIVIILPMTDEKGAYAVKGRLDKKFLQTDFVINEEKVELNIIISVTSFDTRKSSDYKNFKELISTRHKIEEDMCSKL
jgi:GGDEF domain-containing protein